MQIRSLVGEDPLEKAMATHSSILALWIPWTEEPGGLQSMGLQRVGHDLATKEQNKILLLLSCSVTASWLSGLWWSFLYSSVYSCHHLFLISSASVRSIPFLSFIEPIFAWNVPLVSLISLKRSLDFPFYCFPLFLCIGHWGRLSCLSLLFFGTLLSNGNIFPFLLCFSLLFFSQLFVRLPQTAILPCCVSFSWGWSWSLPPVQRHEFPPIVLQALAQSTKSNLLNLLVTSTV